MKKVFIRESSLEDIKNSELLPPFLFKMVKYHKTSLGDNEAFPKVGEYPFDYSILKKRFGIVSFSLKSLARLDSELDGLDEESLLNYLGSLVRKCKEYEKPIKDTLENIAENALNRLFAIPDGTINITAELTDKITFKHSPRITPESDEGLKYTFKDIADIEFSNKAVEKRRFINSLIQGGSRRMLDTALISEDIIFNDLNKINPELIPLYKKIMIINDYLLFTKEEELDDKNPMQGAYVETHIGADGERSTIEAQGIIFPLLLQELIKGLFEVFSTHGLPSDKKKAMYVIKKADFLLAEPWDMRFGVGLWDAIFGDIHESNVIPYVFTKLIELPTDEFNSSVREILASTEAGNNILDDLVNAAQYDSDYQEFKNKINKKNIDKSVIADSYFSAAELTGLELDDDNDNVIEEGDGDGIDYIKLIKSATVDNIDFNEGKITTNGGEQLILTIDGTEIPSEYVDLVVFFMGNELNGKHFKSLNLHIILAEEIQGLGLGTKIYTKMVYEFGSLYSWGETRNNDEHIGKIYQKLSNDPKIEVTTIPNENGKVDYLAVLKGYNIFEGKDKNGELITEGWGQDKKRIIDRCVRLIMDANPAMTTSGAYMLEKKIMDVYFHEYGMGSSLKIRKFEPMVVKILVEELGYPSCPVTSKEQNFLKNIVKCIWNFEVKKGKTPMAVGSFDKNGPDNFETLVAKYKPFIEEIEKSGMNLNGKAKGDNEYTIIPIPDFETANKWGNWSFPGNANEYGKLCYTTGRGTWDSWINGGENSCFLCLNEKTYKNWPIDTYPQDNENTPYDEYGLSMVWVFVDKNGNLIQSNTRWNHHRQERIPEMPYGGIGVDESFSKEALEDLLGKPFDVAFKIEGGFKKLTDEVNERLEAINREGDKYDIGKIESLFNKNGWSGYVFNAEHDIVLISKGGKENLIKKVNGKWELAFPNIWFDHISSSINKEILATGCIDGLYNLIDLDCNFILPNNLWVNNIHIYETNICGEKVFGYLLEKNGLKNIFVLGKGLVFDKFVYELRGANLNTTYTINKDGSITVYPPDGGSPVSLNKIVETYLKTGELHLPVEMGEHFNIRGNIVNFYDYKNLINQNTGKLFDYWFKNLRKDSDGMLIMFDDYHVNTLKENGELLIDKSPLEWPYHISKYFEKYYIIDGQGSQKENICDLNGNFLFDINDESNWVTDIHIENSNIPGRKIFMHLADYDVDKHNLADENLNLLWKQPKSKWFDSVKFKGGLKTGLFPVKMGEKWNYFSVFENDFLYKQPEENWFNFTRTFLPNALLAVVRFGESHFNFIDVNGNLLFEKSYINDVIPYDEQEVVIVENDSGQENIVDLELGNIVSDEWFDSVKENRGKIRYFICHKDDEIFYYDSANGRFTENKGKYSSHDFSDYTHNLKEYLERYRFEIKDELIPNKLYTVVDNEYVEGEKMNIVGVVNGMVQYLLPEWCEFISGLHGHGVCCKIKDNYENLFDISKLQYVFPEPMRDITYYHVGGCFVAYTFTADGYHCNFVDENCNVMLKNSPREIFEIGLDEDRNEYFLVEYDDGKNIFCPNKNGFLMKRNYDILDVVRLDFIIIGIKNDNKRLYNLLGKNGEPAFETWANEITVANERNYAIVKYAKEDGTYSINIFNLDNGEFISDEFLERFERNGHVFFKAVKNGKINYLRNCYKPSEITPIWADNVINEFEDGKHALVMVNGKEYTLITNDRTGKIDVEEGDVYGFSPQAQAEINNLKRQLVQTIKKYGEINSGPNGEYGNAYLQKHIDFHGENVRRIGFEYTSSGILILKVGIQRFVNGNGLTKNELEDIINGLIY